MKVQNREESETSLFRLFNLIKALKRLQKKRMSVFASRQRQLEEQICLCYTFVSCLPQITLKGERARDGKKRMKAFRGNAAWWEERYHLPPPVCVRADVKSLGVKVMTCSWSLALFLKETRVSNTLHPVILSQHARERLSRYTGGFYCFMAWWFIDCTSEYYVLVLRNVVFYYI